MLKKLLIVVVIIAGALLGLHFYADYAPGSRVALAVNRFSETFPNLIKRKQLRGSDVVDFGKGLVEQAERDEAKQSGKAVVYKWRDASGNWNYGSAPPPGVQATAQELDLTKTNKLSQ